MYVLGWGGRGGGGGLILIERIGEGIFEEFVEFVLF